MAVAFAAADTYVVVLALPDMMTTVGLGVDELQRAAPIVSGFLLGYVAVLPLVGRIADLRGRVPVLVGSLVVFALGSLVTALAFDLPSVVTGRFLQGVGGGGLVPATLALVADLYPPHRRAVPLGVVSAVQEVGSVLGPLYGALVLAVADWEAIFWLNLAVALVLAAALRTVRRRPTDARAVDAHGADRGRAAGSSTGSEGTASSDHGGRAAGSSTGSEGTASSDHGGRAASASGEHGGQAASASERVETPAPEVEPVETPAPTRRAFPDVLSALLLLVGTASAVLLLAEPQTLVTDVELGLAFVPLTGESRWLTPLALAALACLVLLVVRSLTARRPLLDLRGWAASLRQADPLGSALLAVVLACVILTFASADPAVSTFSPAGPWLLAAAAVAAVVLVLHLRRARHPLVPRGAMARRPAWGSLLVSFFVGAALIAALVDIPVYARLTTYRDSQLDAALVLVRLLVAIPVGAILGGYAARRVPVALVTAVGMLASAAGFVVMSQWGARTLENPLVTLPLLLTGLGFGLALAPVNAALLDATPASAHGLVSALAVVARMVGMLVGISVLSAVGLRRYYATLTPGDELAAALNQTETIFLGAAGCAVVAAVLALVLLRAVGTSAHRVVAVS
ncbi:hypothetical protein GCM10011519_02500 [Marmoricola endophyticus]|uniref:Major facilitator superfamily (MFS) profile domain-containing protein n=1 Tax=Marmoricola endophyticus TaxID=2040280 RepID=A0A917BBH9_9ACTN|nr:hypothetical protein GCM10011519_02500 [Marmoricola endophyticus]